MSTTQSTQDRIAYLKNCIGNHKSQLKEAELRNDGAMKGLLEAWIAQDEAELSGIEVEKEAEGLPYTTQGPWHVDIPFEEPGVYVSHNETTALIAKVYDRPNIFGENIKAEQMANARLIAEAPEMFKLIKEYAEEADCGDGGLGKCTSPETCWHCRSVELVNRVLGKGGQS